VNKHGTGKKKIVLRKKCLFELMRALRSFLSEAKKKRSLGGAKCLTDTQTDANKHGTDKKKIVLRKKCLFE